MKASGTDTAAAIAANRFGLGARPTELASAGADPAGWLLGQLKGAPPVLSEEGLRPSAETLAKALELRKEVAGQRRDGDEALVKTAVKVHALYRPIYIDEAFARLSHSIGTDRPFLERLTQFWTN